VPCPAAAFPGFVRRNQQNRYNPVDSPFVRFRRKKCRNRAIIYSCVAQTVRVYPLPTPPAGCRSSHP
jgi:hypothetical protein